jgi:CDP-diacylglycerol--serine O-phosphatidyltransferase
MIGFYDYTVILTYISLMCSVFGMTQAIDGRFRTALVCLALSGLCDMFDGKIARTKKNRTDDQKLFGVQIDSLCDVICFGAFPALLCYVLGVRGILGSAAITYYCICSVIRLGFFNVLETNRQLKEDGANKYYYGLPITSITIILPFVFLLSFFISAYPFKWVLMATLFIVGTLFILKFRLRKPSNKELTLLVIIVALAVSVILLYSDYRIKSKHVQEKALIEKLSE